MTFDDYTIKQLIYMIKFYNSEFPNNKIVYAKKTKSELVRECEKVMFQKGITVRAKENPNIELNLIITSTKYKNGFKK